MGERQRTAALLREINRMAVSSAADDIEFKIVADNLERLRDELTSHDERGKESRVFIDENGERQFQLHQSMIDFNPTHGACHPFSVPLECSHGEGRAWAKANYDRRFEGHGGFVHGGFVSFAFDEIAAHTMIGVGGTVVTGTLKVYYRAPVPLNRDLVYEAWVERETGSKVLGKATLKDGETLLCEADVVYVKLDPKRFEEKFQGS